MKQIARRYCWWPKIDDDIANVSSSCQACCSHSTNPPKQFSSWPCGLWQRIHVDYAEGLPETIVTDNGTQFTSNDFKAFCEVHGIHHLTTAQFPPSNGNAERFVRTFKTSIKKQLSDGSSLQTSVLAYLITYITTPNSSRKLPAELLHGRYINQIRINN